MSIDQRAQCVTYALVGSVWLIGVLFSPNVIASMFFAAALWFEYVALNRAFQDDSSEKLERLIGEIAVATFERAMVRGGRP